MTQLFELSEDAGQYGLGYFRDLASASNTVSAGDLARAGMILNECIAADGQIFACGNGGSAAIANHLVCDCLKGTRASTSIRPRVTSLSSNVELLTAVMNDIGQQEVFAYPLQSLGKPGDVLVTISSSGNSPNIIRAIEQALELGMKTIALTGFSGGGSSKLADVNVHVQSDNYGVIEDLHQSMMHILAQYLRLSNLDANVDASRLVF